MTALVRIALRRPYTFVVLALLLLILGPLAAWRTPVDIFPEIRIPVIATIWGYTGLPPEQMAGRMVTQFERALTTTVNDIEHIEATSYTGAGIVKVFFQPGADIRIANSQVTAIAQTLLRNMPPGATPPLILNYDASTVPIIQLGLSGKGLTEQMLNDIAINFLRVGLVTVPGAAIPYPYGGKFRQIQIDLDSAAMQARGLSGQDVANALAAQNLITPVGTEKIGDFEYAINLNNAPSVISELGDLPIKSVNGAMVYVRDVAHVRDGNPPQSNIVHVDGNRSVLMMVLKNGGASTLAVIDGIKKKLPELQRTLPGNLKIAEIADQSFFVKAAIGGVVREGVIAAALTSLMILLFLGSFRSTLIIATSIPLSVLGSIATLWALGETLNIMTLGGLALAVGILVDEATVTIENINWHLEQGKEVETAILDGAAADRDAGLRLAAVHLHRVRADVLPDRRAALPVRAAGRSGHVGDGLVVHSVAHAGADDGEIHAAPACLARRRARRGRAAAALAQSFGAPAARVRAALRAIPLRLSRAADDGAASSRRLRDLLSRLRDRHVRAGAVSRARLFPECRRRSNLDACARACRHARRGKRAAVRDNREGHPPSRSAA